MNVEIKYQNGLPWITAELLDQCGLRKRYITDFEKFLGKRKRLLFTAKNIKKALDRGLLLDFLFTVLPLTPSEELKRVALASGIPEYAYWYGLCVLKAHDEELKQAVLSDPHYACQYAANVLKGPDEEIKQVVLNDPYQSYRYLVQVLKEHDEELEKAILNSAWAEAYARNINRYLVQVLKEHDEELEKAKNKK